VEVSFRVLFWVSAIGEKPVADWMKTLESKDRVYFGDLCVVVAAGDKSSQRRDIELAKKRLRMTEVD
jgi:hypothetical protein